MPDREAEGRPSEESESAKPRPVTPPQPSDGPHQGAAAAEDRPIYKGAPLDAECGPGLGCFWIQVVTLVVLLILTPLTVILAFPSWVSAALLILSLVILFFVGQTSIFLLRLVAADRRAARRQPLSPTARKTIGQLGDAVGHSPARAAAAQVAEPISQADTQLEASASERARGGSHALIRLAIYIAMAVVVGVVLGVLHRTFGVFVGVLGGILVALGAIGYRKRFLRGYAWVDLLWTGVALIAYFLTWWV